MLRHAADTSMKAVKRPALFDLMRPAARSASRSSLFSGDRRVPNTGHQTSHRSQTFVAAQAGLKFCTIIRNVAQIMAACSHPGVLLGLILPFVPMSHTAGCH